MALENTVSNRGAQYAWLNVTCNIQNKNPDLLVMTCYYWFLSVGDVARVLVTMRGIISAEQLMFSVIFSFTLSPHSHHVHFQRKQNKSCSTSCGRRGKWSLVVLIKSVPCKISQDSDIRCMYHTVYLTLILRAVTLEMMPNTSYQLVRGVL